MVESPKPSLSLFWWGMRVQEGCFWHGVLLLGCSPGAQAQQVLLAPRVKTG